MRTTIVAILLLFMSAGMSLAQEPFWDKYNVMQLDMRSGLSNNFVDDIYKDDKGFVWFATSGGGVVRFDGYDYEIYDVSSERRLQSNFTHEIAGDRFGRLWITGDGGVDVLDIRENNIVTENLWPADKMNLVRKPSMMVKLDDNGNIWFTSGTCIYAVSFKASGEIASISEYDNKIAFTALENCNGKLWAAAQNSVYMLQVFDARISLETVDLPLVRQVGGMVTCFFAKDNETWIGTDKGLHRVNLSSGMAKHYDATLAAGALTQNRITDIVETADHEIIVSTLKGINVFNPFTDSFEQVGQATYDHRGISSNFVNCMMSDGDLLWLGTEICGVDVLIPNELAVNTYVHGEEPTSIAANPVNAILEDKSGTLWIGNVESGLSRKAKGKNHFEHYTVENHGLAHNSISALELDRNGRLWTGTWGNGIAILDINRSGCPVVEKMTDLSSSFVGTLIYDGVNDGMWVGTTNQIYFMRGGRRYTPIHCSQLENMNGAIGAAIDTRNRLWMGTSEGLLIIDLETMNGDSVSYQFLGSKFDEPQSGINPRVSYIAKASDGTMYVGTNGYGMFCCHEGMNDFVAVTVKDGLSNNSVRGIVEDNLGNIWVSTNSGISVYEPGEKNVVNYSKANGLMDDSYYWNAAFKSPTTGNVYFGSISGLTEIRRRVNTVQSRSVDSPVFTKFILGGRADEDGAIRVNVVYSKSVNLHERDKSFAIEFSSLNYHNPNAIRYQYRMSGFDDHWIETSHDRRVATYTNLTKGDYIFEVRCSDGHGSWSKAEQLKIHIEPFFYKTFWFYMLMMAIIAFLFWQLYAYRVRSLKEQKRLLHLLVSERTEELERQKLVLEEKTQELEQQNVILSDQNIKITQQKESILEMSNKIQKLSVDKLQFFTNISHEIRTPITLIIGPIQRAMKLSTNPAVIEQLQLVDKNSQLLLQLVNQLMDFRKVETGNMERHPSSNRLVPFVNDIVHPFGVFASERNVRVESYYRVRTEMVMFDVDAMSKVLTNLLSNAVKYTTNNGHVQLFMATLMMGGKEVLYISVRDNGEGIPEADLEKIFNRYYQSENHTKHPLYGQSGTGIGLYLCRRLVEQAGGSIIARNNKGGGCSIRVIVPFEEGIPIKDEKKAEEMAAQVEQEETEEADETYKMSILVVEDNKDMRHYIRTIVEDQYQVFEAKDGVEGLTQLAENDIDFIICDLMMPVMDGIEFATRVKNNFSFSHIPILVLTAQMSDEFRTKSYKIGVESYLHKPFDEQMLLARISGILEGKKVNQKKFQYTLNTDDLNIDKESDDEKFVKRVLEHVETHYTDSAYAIDDILRDLGCSKSMLNKKMQNVIGQSPGVFIRSYRLNVAKQLIMKNRESRSMNISQIAYEVGFNDPKYFTRCFTKHFCITPSVMLDGGGETDEE